MPTYFAIITTLGLQRLAEAQASGNPLVFTDLAVGDGNGSEITPLASMTELVNETARVSVNSVEIAPGAPTTVRVEGLIPAATGGFTIREAGLFNGDGELIAIASYPPIYKPVPADGVSVEEYIRILLVYEETTAIALTVDTSVIIATRLYVDERDDVLEGEVDALDERVADLEINVEGIYEALIFGDGSDGDCEVDGTNTFPWASKVGSVYTLTRDVYANTFTIPTGALVQVNTHGYRIFCKETFEIVPTIGSYVGANGADANASPGTIAGTGASGAGGSGAGSAGGNNVGVTVGSGDGGAGGAGSGGAGGAAGTPTDLSGPYGGTGVLSGPLIGYVAGGGATPTNGLGVLTMMSGGGGGGGGGGDGGSGGGTGGRGAGVLVIVAREIVLSVASGLQVKGQNGANGGAANRGGGGGGGGGTLILVYGSLTVSSGTVDAATCCTGGSAGSGGGGSGVAGSAGSNGVVLEYAIATEAPELSIGHEEDGYFTVASYGAGLEYEVEFDTPFENATGANGYVFDVNISYNETPYDGRVDWWVTEKTVNGFKINLSDDLFTGEIRWSARR